MKTLNPRVFLREGELYAFVEKVPEAPYDKSSGGMSEHELRKEHADDMKIYNSLLKEAKASAIKVKNQDEVNEWLCDEYGEKILSRLEYTLEGYQMEVIEEPVFSSTWKEDYVRHGLKHETIKLAIISPCRT